MELELHQLELRYESLRKRHPAQERQLLASLAEVGQQLPIVVIGEAARFVVIDGYKRVRALKRLARDTIRGTRWEMPEVEALLLERRMRCASEDALDQAWLMVALQERFGLSLEELARGFERSRSWVSRRLGLIQVLPGAIQEQVRAGVLSAHAAMKYLLPLARANAAAVTELSRAIVSCQPTTRQVGALCAGWRGGTERTRELILASPHIFLQAQVAQSAPEPSATQRWLNDLGALAGMARRARKPLEKGLLQQLLACERRAVDDGFARARADVDRLFVRLALESGHAG
ncbi:MAG: ParB N-terminal domain-containing protein [Anaerolineae bacterium]|nr:ParB N-terminal domain-containing protein [Anaerolineae bacterium]